MDHVMKDESKNDTKKTPLVIWLQGGNGCSSLIGAMTENGPYMSPHAVNGSLLTNPYSLHHLSHVLYLDRPAGSGYSYSRGAPNETWANDKQTALDSRDVLMDILRRYPWLCDREIYVAGESYAGHFTIQLAMAITDKESELCGQLGGVLIGNGVVDINQTNFAWFEAGATHTLVDEAVWGSMKEECDFTKDLGMDT